MTSRLRDDPDFRRYWVARLVSMAGSLITYVAMPVLVYRLSGSAVLTSVTTLLEALPYLLFGLVAGVVGDSLDRKRVMVAADLAAGLTIVSVPVAWELGVLTVPHALVAGFATQVFFVFFDGANFGALPVLVGRERIGAANAAVWGAGSLIDLTVPAVVGVSLAVVHPADLLVVDAASFVGSALLVRSIRQTLTPVRDAPVGEAGPSGSTVRARVREGLRYLWRHDGVRANTVVSMLQSAGGAGFMALYVPWADRVLQVGTSGWRFAAIYCVWGLGGITASSVYPRLAIRFGSPRVTVWALPVSAVTGVAAASMTHWLPVAAITIVWGVSYQLVILGSISYRQEVTPEHLLSRVNTVGRMVAWGLGWSVGALAAGGLAGWLGLRPAIIVATSLIGLAALYGWLSPLRRLPTGPHDADGRPIP